MTAEKISRSQAESRSGFTVELFGRVTASPSWIGELHHHSFWEFVFIKNGEGTIHLADEEKPFKKGSAFIISPMVKHKFYHNCSSCKADHLYIGFMILDGSLSLLLENSKLFFPDIYDFDEIDPGFTKALEVFCKNIKRNSFDSYNLRKRFEAIALIGRLINIIAEINEPFLSKTSTKRSEIIVQKVLEYISHNLDKNIKVSELASLLYMSPHYLGEMFRKNIGEPIKNYHNRLRMQRAADLLSAEIMNISQIAESLGFESVHYFSRRFKQFHNMSPCKYRNRKCSYNSK